MPSGGDFAVTLARRADHEGDAGGGTGIVSRVFRVYVILFVAIFLLTLVGTLLARFVSPQVGSIVLAVGWGALAIVAIWDGASRLTGRPGLLGGASRLGKILAVAQIVLGIAVLLSVLNGVTSFQIPTL